MNTSNASTRILTKMIRIVIEKKSAIAENWNIEGKLVRILDDTEIEEQWHYWQYWYF